MATYLTFTQGTPTSNKKFTFSTWLKRGDIGTDNVPFYCGSGSELDLGFMFSDAGPGNIRANWDATASEWLVTNRVFRDPGAWYHIVFAVDTSLASSGDRLRLYINGVEETSFSSESQPSQDATSAALASGQLITLGRNEYSDAKYFRGAMAHTHFIDGLQYAPTVFGETDSTSGIWVPISAPSVTYGNNGFFLKYASGALGTDSSGNGNNLVASGSMTPTKDNAMNSFCTMNPLDNYFNAATFSNGNNYIVTGAPYSYNTATTGLAAGLWYFEVKVVASTTIAVVLGVSTKNSTSTTDYLGSNSDSYSYYGENGKSITGGTQSTYGDTYTDDDIIGVYLDLTANKLYFAKNGTIQNSGTGLSITAAASTTGGFYLPSAGDYDSVNNVTLAFNFGNGYFGTTAISGAVADAGSKGQFKYNPSTGTFDGSSKDFRAICTDNLATYG